MTALDQRKSKKADPPNIKKATLTSGKEEHDSRPVPEKVREFIGKIITVLADSDFQNRCKNPNDLLIEIPEGNSYQAPPADRAVCFYMGKDKRDKTTQLEAGEVTYPGAAVVKIGLPTTVQGKTKPLRLERVLIWPGADEDKVTAVITEAVKWMLLEASSGHPKIKP